MTSLVGFPTFSSQQCPEEFLDAYFCVEKGKKPNKPTKQPHNNNKTPQTCTNPTNSKVTGHENFWDRGLFTSYSKSELQVHLFIHNARTVTLQVTEAIAEMHPVFNLPM